MRTIVLVGLVGLGIAALGGIAYAATRSGETLTGRRGIAGRDGAKLYASADVRSKVVGALSLNEPIVVAMRQGAFALVQTSRGLTGWTLAENVINAGPEMLQ
jgi:hypothetical protein